MPTNTHPDPPESPATEAGPRRVLTLVADGGDRRVLGDWLQASDTYTRVTDDGDLQTIPFDCCIVADDDPDSEAVALADVLTEEVARRRETFEEATIELAEPPAVTVAANELLAAVFRNLVNNAVQHNDTDDPTVAVTAEDRGESVVVRVADGGPGIPDEHKPELFAADTKGLDRDGSGMGLYLVERLIDMYGGEVRVEDNTPRGAVFVVELPTIPADGTAVEEP